VTGLSEIARDEAEKKFKPIHINTEENKKQKDDINQSQ